MSSQLFGRQSVLWGCTDINGLQTQGFVVFVCVCIHVFVCFATSVRVFACSAGNCCCILFATEWQSFSLMSSFNMGGIVGIQPALYYVSQPINQQLRYNTVHLNYQVPQPISWQHNILDSLAHLYVSKFINLPLTIQKIIWFLLVLLRICFKRQH